MFRQFFGDQFAEGKEKRGKDTAHALPVSLEDLYNGHSVRLRIHKQVVCSACEGSQTAPGKKPSPCVECGGKGVKLLLRSLGPGMVQQMQIVCPSCTSTGVFISDDDKCTTCEGRGVNKETKVLEVKVERGMTHGEKIVFQGEGDQTPQIPNAGDVIVVLQERKHPTFIHRGDDLIFAKQITLREALCGTTFYLTHLDKRTLCVKTSPGQVLRPGCVKAIPNEGMPCHKCPAMKGQLLIQFDVKFPEQLSEKAIEQLLPGLSAIFEEEALPENDEAEECFLHDWTEIPGGRDSVESQLDDPDGHAQCVHQ
eukprot:TRINITY_DN59839_c0_g1_i2.p1 TRINITY_DN59839_c0_g1~~TRINITY_DN59839_c0_g1_i2.p1  ORF type:complete len:310 (+),score=30.63 TRINITY_DN59839_c0_g1_i2:339-1268(+)